MKTSWKMLFITLIAGLAAFLLGPIIWTPSPDIHPTQAQLPFLMTLSAVEALTFGFGIAFIIYGFPLIRRISPEKKGTASVFYGALAWILVSWWPHDNLHIHNALDVDGLIVIDYTFHITVILAGFVLAYTFFRLFKPTAVPVAAREECSAGETNCHPEPVRS